MNRSTYPIGTTQPESMILIGEFTTNSTNDPTAVDGMVKSVKRDGVGLFTATLREKCLHFLFADVAAVSTSDVQADVRAKNPLTPSIVIGTRTASALADSTGVVVQVFIVASQSARKVTA